MNSKNLVAVPEEKLNKTCVHCLKEVKEGDLHVINIPELGFGSGFDLYSLTLKLCDECYKESMKECKDIWNMKVVKHTEHFEKNDDKTFEEREKQKEYKQIDTPSSETVVPIDMHNGVIWTEDFDETFDIYEHEKEMFNYINNLPLVGQEMVRNRFSSGCHAEKKMDSQHWIDYYLGELPYDLCKKYKLVSPLDFQAYHEKYEKCFHVVNVIYRDGSYEEKYSYCLLNKIFGSFGGKCKKGHYGCYGCSYFKEKTGNIRTYYESRANDLKKIEREEYDNRFK